MKILTRHEYDLCMMRVYFSLQKNCDEVRKFELYLIAVLDTNYQEAVGNAYIKRLINKWSY